MTRMEPRGAFGEGVFIEACKWCKRATACQPVVVLERRATYSSPAEYGVVRVCADCRERNAYLGDPDNAAYEQARAQGWRD